jgi:CBS-domain-containing membrane protein
MRYEMRDLMTRDVVTVGTEASYREVVTLMDRHRVAPCRSSTPTAGPSASSPRPS